MGDSMKNRAILIVVSGLFLTSSSFAADKKFVGGRATSEIKLATGQVIEIQMQTSILDAASPVSSSFRWGGDKVFHPKSYISSFSVIADKSAVPVSLSAYVDLGDPSEVSIKETNYGFELSVMGGDAGVAYKSIYSFKRIDGQIWLHSRKVMLLEFPEQAWEETTYSDPVKTD